MTRIHHNRYKAGRHHEQHHASTKLCLYVTDQQGYPVTAGEVFVIGTNRSAVLDNSGYAIVEDMPLGDHSFSLTTPFGTNTYGQYDFKNGKTLTFHVQVNANSTLATPMVTGKVASALRMR